ncbi:tRNA modification GTPase MnmE [Alicyclobacillus cellulosilyticus]|uniref:tRNA modification GTPase MnmE n=1 Tax=Alicyclobacillus cellulosilyticus TaxID=1003997 RepID=A0A917K0P9_9BACL|nr:tRNA uridine-5-carboxymethylaminomethyl(34) synthesis GTPase MnmE [Alicyclobacillus cellulosilyticus]GGI95047.1 tRNA modification GTPase MnmE [Alicyclobacillus cellulosilyticus]
MGVATDTIAAIATALGEASIGVVRVSGPEAGGVVQRVFRTPRGKAPKLGPRRSIHYGLVVAHDGTPVDECILLWMPGPHSYTAEDVAELQVHGGVRLVESVLDCVLAAGARLAEPGEFTKRAFLHGRLDLSQAEAVIDLIRAKTELASRSALSQVRGQFGEKIRDLRRRLLRLQAHVEVTIDYPEHDVEDVASAEVVRVGEALMAEVERLLAGAKMGRILREGVATVLAGRPNVGKSSLLNALLRRERAIVTDIPGTTRDVLEEYVNLRGVPFRLLDTAGIRETDDVVERIGVERTRAALSEAELVLVLLNGAEPLTAEDEAILAETSAVTRVVVVNKADLPQAVDLAQVRAWAGASPVVQVSAKRWDGLAQLEETMVTLVIGGEVQTAEASYMTNARQAQWLREALADLRAAVQAAKEGATLDIVAVSLQAAYASLGMVIGEEVGEDLLDEIFSQFCLGK